MCMWPEVDDYSIFCITSQTELYSHWHNYSVFACHFFRNEMEFLSTFSFRRVKSWRSVCFEKLPPKINGYWFSVRISFASDVTNRIHFSFFFSFRRNKRKPLLLAYKICLYSIEFDVCFFLFSSLLLLLYCHTNSALVVLWVFYFKWLCNIIWIQCEHNTLMSISMCLFVYVRMYICVW